MEFLTLLLGGITVLGTAADAVYTTLALGGGGPLMRAVARIVWHLFPRRRRSGGGAAPGILAGPTILLAVFAAWSLLLWCGWSIVFSAAPDAVVNSKTGQSAGIWDRVYFAGYLLTTLGIGDYRPQGTFYQLSAAVAGGNGFFFITLSVTYLLSVLSAVIAKRKLAFSILSLGRTPTELVLRGWEHGEFGELVNQVTQTSDELAMLAQRHLAYPVLHYFQTEDVHMAPTVAVAVLDECLTVVLHGMPTEHRPSAMSLLRARRAIELYTGTVGPDHESRDGAPPPPRLQPLRDAGIPTVDDAVFAAQMQALTRRRARLRAVVENDGWRWETVVEHLPSPHQN